MNINTKVLNKRSRMYRISRIIFKNGKWSVVSEKGKNLGTYSTEQEAKKRLRQVEYFKHKKSQRFGISGTELRKKSFEDVKIKNTVGGKMGNNILEHIARKIMSGMKQSVYGYEPKQKRYTITSNDEKNERIGQKTNRPKPGDYIISDKYCQIDKPCCVLIVEPTSVNGFENLNDFDSIDEAGRTVRTEMGSNKNTDIWLFKGGKLRKINKRGISITKMEQKNKKTSKKVNKPSLFNTNKRKLKKDRIHTMKKKSQSDMHIWNELADYLTKRSSEICKDNGCTGDEHYCESVAYITADGTLQDICNPSYWQGWGTEDRKIFGEVVGIPLPFEGNGKELQNEVKNMLRMDF